MFDRAYEGDPLAEAVVDEVSALLTQSIEFILMCRSHFPSFTLDACECVATVFLYCSHNCDVEVSL